MKVNTYSIVTRYLRSRTSDRRTYVTLGCERRGVNKSSTKLRVDDEEEVRIKRWANDHENWQLFLHDGRHNNVIGVYNHGRTQAARLTEEQQIPTEQFRKSHLPPRNILRFFQEQNVGCAMSI
ncbi:hypothetical protein M9H77_03272 [Catharanthus roseus]|uniref:Uncharacterized protein n=1 Tax=Catharanthus roseus TaxID=4058 RepID=A0ACC0CAY0_CATRO|nr:hypothetical protein M9H77_03272 [Catharanthus roseus]